MKFHTTLSEFNRRIADRVRVCFSHDVTPQQGTMAGCISVARVPALERRSLPTWSRTFQSALTRCPEAREENEGYLIENLSLRSERSMTRTSRGGRRLEAKGTVGNAPRE